jgi:hypothetical protein
MIVSISIDNVEVMKIRPQLSTSLRGRDANFPWPGVIWGCGRLKLRRRAWKRASPGLEAGKCLLPFGFLALSARFRSPQPSRQQPLAIWPGASTPGARIPNYFAPVLGEVSSFSNRAGIIKMKTVIKMVCVGREKTGQEKDATDTQARHFALQARFRT